MPFEKWWIEEWGQPPFIPVSITAGLKGVVSSTGSMASRTASGSGTMKGTGAGVTSTGTVPTTTSSSGARRLGSCSGLLSGMLVVWVFGCVGL